MKHSQNSARCCPLPKNIFPGPVGNGRCIEEKNVSNRARRIVPFTPTATAYEQDFKAHIFFGSVYCRQGFEVHGACRARHHLLSARHQGLLPQWSTLSHLSCIRFEQTLSFASLVTKKKHRLSCIQCLKRAITLFDHAPPRPLITPKGIFRSLMGGVTNMIATTDGIARTQDALLLTSRGLLEGDK